MEKSIRLSPKHGLNPSIGVCFLCGEESGEIIIPGRLKDDAEAPRKAIWHKEPCPKCQEWMQQGIILISIRNGDEGKENPYRTGGWVVVKEEVIGKMIDSQELVNQILKARMCFIPDEVWDSLGIPRGEVNK